MACVRELGRGVVLADEFRPCAELGLQAAVFAGGGIFEKLVLLVVRDMRRDVQSEPRIPVGHFLQVLRGDLLPAHPEGLVDFRGHQNGPFRTGHGERGPRIGEQGQHETTDARSA